MLCRNFFFVKHYKLKKSFIMKRNALLLSFFFACSMLMAQSLPTHENYVPLGADGRSWYEAYANWNKGVPLYSGLEEAENENFFISRVKPRDRFVYTPTQVKENLNPARKLLWWCPMGKSGWNAVPTFFFNAEVFSMWSYVDVYGNWTAPMVQAPGAFLDVCHKNGVAASTVAAIPFGAVPNPSDGGNGQMIRTMVDGGYAKFLSYLNYYGIDGVGWNSEFSWSSMSNYMNGFKNFMGDCYANAEAGGVPLFHNAWYSFTSNSGGTGDYSYLDSNCSDWFHYNGKKVSSVYFLNYNWGDTRLSTSQNTANGFSGRSSFDVFAGINYQSGGAVQFPALQKYDISVGLWGAHDMNMIYENRGEQGSDPVQQQKTYQLISENSFTGSSYNPVNTPPVTTLIAHSSKATEFHGFSSFIVARSSLTCEDLSEDPFVTYFNLGNGQFFNVEGETTFNNDWYNIGMQDYLPTWRWWWTKNFMGKSESDVSEDMTAEFSWDDAWFGGSCLQISGETDQAYLQLFKTKYDMANTGDKITIRYKVVSGSGTMAWACATEESLTGSGNSEISRTIATNATASEDWVTVTANIGGRNSLLVNNQTLALIGLKFIGTTADFKVRIGEISLTRGTSTTPLQPQIETAKTLERNYMGVGAKVIFNMASDKVAPVYNSDVNTWFFKVYTQQEGGEETMCTATTSWAAYVIGAPYDVNLPGKRIRIGVSAVSLDGKSESAITWSDWMDVPAADIVEGYSINKPVIKAGEEFTIGFDDPNHSAANWEIKSASDNQSQYTSTGTSITTSLDEEGLYDLYVTINGETEVRRGYIQISPAAVGAMPEIYTLTANGKEDNVEAAPNANVEFVYAGRPNTDGVVSRGIALNENAFGIPVEQLNWGNTTPFSLCFWFYVSRFNHGDNGTQLVNIRASTDAWPASDWGFIWSTIGKDGNYALSLRKGSENGGWPASTSFSFSPETWYHVAIVSPYTGRRDVQIYVNGNLVGQLDDGPQSDVYGWLSTNTIMIGGKAHQRAGLDGNIDEVQLYNRAITADEVKASMQHQEQDALPEGMIGYWDFESDAQSDNMLLSTGTDKSLEAGMLEFISLGENNSRYEAREFSFATGAPFISGEIFEIKTVPSWTYRGATLVSGSGDGESGSSTVKYSEEGIYSATLTLSNGWGSDTKTINYIEITADASGIEDVSIEEMRAFPNPFVNEVYVRFAEEGTYMVELYDTAGRLIGSNSLSVNAGDMINIPVNGQPGMYFMKVYSGDTLLKTMSLIKK